MKVFNPQYMGFVTLQKWMKCGFPWYRLFFYIMIWWYNDIHLHMVHLSESRTHHTKNINHRHEAHFTNTFWDVRWGDVTMIFFPKPRPHSVEDLSNVPSPYFYHYEYGSLKLLIRNSLYSCVGSLEIYLFSPRSPDEWMFCSNIIKHPLVIGSLFGWENDINRFQSSSNFQRPCVAGVSTQNEGFQKTIPLKVWRKQGHPGESALQQKPATMRFDYKMAILVPATQKNTKCTSCKIS